MSRLNVLYWFDIPGQVVVKQGRRSQRLRLAPRFSAAIQRAGYRVRKQGGDALFDPWRQQAQPIDGRDLQEQARLLVQRLEAEYDEQRLEQLVRSGGRDVGAEVRQE